MKEKTTERIGMLVMLSPYLLSGAVVIASIFCLIVDRIISMF